MSKVIIFSAPSGSGKSTIINRLMQHPELKLAFSISCTSREPRGNEQHGVEYFFLSPDEFRARIEAGEGQNVVLDVDVKGGCNIKKHYQDKALSVFIQPPSIDELKKRLVSRGTDSAEVIEDRLAKAEFELSFAPQYDVVIVNDDIEIATKKAFDVIKSFINQ